ncbi:hypothetical protein D3C80_1468340 [compost metagenome]
MKMARAPNRAQRDFSAEKMAAAPTGSAASWTGAAALICLRAEKMKAAIRAKKPPMARKAKSMLRRDSPRVATVTTAPAAKTPPVSRTCAPSHGPTVAPRELKAWEKTRRKCELFLEPSSATRGLAATCSRVTPEAMTNRASRMPG